jgi:hypothetical protein
MNLPDHPTNEDYCLEMVRVAENFLPLEHWGFKQSAFLADEKPRVIYDSKWCRIMLLWGGSVVSSAYSVGIFYGRLHALNDGFVMMWSGENCHCWHQVYEALFLLDRLSPKDAVDRIRINDKRPQVIEDFERDNLVKLRNGMPPTEWDVKMHAMIWEHYGERLFELFDLRHAELWEKYAQFVKEFYELLGLDFDSSPPPDKIC